MKNLKKLIKMLRRKCTSYDRVGYLKDMQKYLTLFNIAVANKIMLVNRDDLNLAIDKLVIILKNSIKKRGINA